MKLSLPEFLALSDMERTRYVNGSSASLTHVQREDSVNIEELDAGALDSSFVVVIPSKIVSNLHASVDAIQRNEPGARIVWIDDRDNQQAAYQLPKRVQRICGIKPFVFARNCNLGIRASQSDVIVMNDDALLETPGGFSKLAAAATAHPEYGVLAATTNKNGNLNQCQRGSGCWDEPWAVAFVCVYISRSTIERVGLMDEDFVGYGREDGDYCLRIQEAGMKVGICGDCFVNHAVLQSSYRLVNPYVSLTANDRVFYRKHGRWPDAK